MLESRDETATELRLAGGVLRLRLAGLAEERRGWEDRYEERLCAVRLVAVGATRLAQWLI